MSKTFSLGLAALVSLTAACGGIAVLDDGAGGDAATATGTTRASTSATKSASASTRASTSIQGSTNVMSGGSPDIRPAILSSDLYGDCFSKPGADLLHGSVTVRYDNIGLGEGSVSLVGADLSFATPTELWVFDMVLTPQSSGPIVAGSSAVLVHDKLTTMADTSDVCSLCGQVATVRLRYDTGAQTEMPYIFGCAF